MPRRRTASSGCRRRAFWESSAAASIRGSSPARCWSKRRSRSMRARPSTGAKVSVRGPLEVLEGSPKPAPSRSPTVRATPPPPQRADPDGLCAPTWRGIGILPRSGASPLSTLRCAASPPKLRACARGARGRNNGRLGVQLTGVQRTSGVAGRYATALFELRRTARRLTRSRPTPPPSRRRSPRAASFATCCPRRSSPARTKARRSPGDRQRDPGLGRS